jgi:CRISPR-associated endoribonuclease Cas2 subtype I-E
MAKLVVIDVAGAPARVTGKLQRLLLEIRPGTFVGRLSSSAIKTVWSIITTKDCDAIAVVSAKNEAGFRIATHGKNRRMIVDNHGVQLVEYTRVERKTVGKHEEVENVC